MLDYSQPGSDGALPDGFKEWQWGVIYTVQPELLSPLVRAREYRISAVTRRKVVTGEEFTDYEELYRRAAWMASARLAEITCADEGGPLHTWLTSHAWGCFGETHRAAFAGVGLGLIFPNDGESRPQGVSAPDPAELTSPRLMPEVVESRRLDEIYNEFDVRELPGPDSDIFLFSYGEYVADHRGLRFDAFVERAERLASAHGTTLQGPESGPMEIVKREWMWATNPDVAVVHVHFRAPTSLCT
jgi:hypothetical protein